MTRLVVLLRAINVGKRQLPMAVLRAGLEGAGCRDVVTYIQSGNVVLTPVDGWHNDVQRRLAEAISQIAGFDVPVVVRALADLESVVQSNPFPEASGSQSHVIFFSEPADPLIIAGLDLASYSPETCELRGSELHLYLPNGMGRSRLAVDVDKACRRAKSVGTARNWNTVLKLVELASQ